MAQLDLLIFCFIFFPLPHPPTNLCCHKRGLFLYEVKWTWMTGHINPHGFQSPFCNCICYVFPWIKIFWTWTWTWKKGITLPNFSLSGNIPVHRDWLIIILNGRETTCLISFSNFFVNIVMTRARFRPEISYICRDVIGICVGEIKWGCARGGKVRIKWNFVSSIDWSG